MAHIQTSIVVLEEYSEPHLSTRAVGRDEICSHLLQWYPGATQLKLSFIERHSKACTLRLASGLRVEGLGVGHKGTPKTMQSMTVRLVAIC